MGHELQVPVQVAPLTCRRFREKASCWTFFIERPELDQIAAPLLEMIKTLATVQVRACPVRDIQVSCPMNRGAMVSSANSNFAS